MFSNAKLFNIFLLVTILILQPRKERKIFLKLKILRGKNCGLLNSVQEVVKIEAWLLQTFFKCLQNQISSIYSIAIVLRLKMQHFHTKLPSQKKSILRQIRWGVQNGLQKAVFTTLFFWKLCFIYEIIYKNLL